MCVHIILIFKLTEKNIIHLTTGTHPAIAAWSKGASPDPAQSGSSGSAPWDRRRSTAVTSWRLTASCSSEPVAGTNSLMLSSSHILSQHARECCWVVNYLAEVLPPSLCLRSSRLWPAATTWRGRKNKKNTVDEQYFFVLATAWLHCFPSTLYTLVENFCTKHHTSLNV